MPQPLSVVELENLLGPHLHLADAGLVPPLVLAHRYMVQKIVGKGARGLVCKGRDVRLDRDVAVKLYPADPALIREVEAEAKALARLRHPNIIGVYDAGQAEFLLGPPCSTPSDEPRPAASPGWRGAPPRPSPCSS
jgi:hypothetical protein